MGQWTEEEMRDLTDDERRALEDDDDDAGAEADDDDDSDTDDAGDEGGGDEDEGADAGEDAGDDDGAGDDDHGDSGDDEEGADGSDADTRDQGGDDEGASEGPLLKAEAPEDAKEKLADIETNKGKLVEQFDDGELTPKEYQLELDKLYKQEREIERQQLKAEISEDMAREEQQRAWARTVDSFLAEHQDYQKPRMNKLLDIEVRTIAADESNANLSGAEILEKAHENIMGDLGVKDDGGKKRRTPSKDKPEIPPNLGRTPAAEATEVDDGRWARMDKLMERDPERYEAELAKMSDADRDAYLMAQ